MSRKRIAAFGFLYDIGGTAILQFVTFVVTPVYLNLASPQQYGYWLTIGSILNWLYLSDFGIGLALLRSAVAAIESKNVFAFHSLIRTAFVLFWIAALVFFTVGISISGVFLNWFEVPDEHRNFFLITYFLTLVTGGITFPFSVFGSVVQAYQKIAYHRIITSATTLLGIGVTVLLLLAGLGLVSFSLGMLVTVASAALFNYLYFRKLIPGFSFLPFRIDRAVSSKLIRFGGYFQLGQLANIVALNTVNIIIASFLTATVVSTYALTSKLALLFSVTLISKIPNALFPGLSQLVEQQDIKGLQRTFLSLFRICLRLGLMAALFVFVVNETFVDNWVGPENYGGDDLNLAWVYIILMDSVIRGISIFVFSFGDLKGWAIASLAETVLNITLSLILINYYGIVGVAVATAIARTVTVGIYTPTMLSKRMELPIAKLFGNILEVVARSLISMAAGLVFIFIKIDMNPWVWMAMVGATIVLANFLCFEFPYLLKSDKQSLKERILTLKSYY
jgi:O-antigen/teichoic acid export membrane protein